jgi:GMP synthase-like glutamine amidotransferase
MRVHFIQHVEFEEPAELENWIINKGYKVTKSKMHNKDLFPNITDFDMLIVMGGPMGVNDLVKYPWLIREKEFIRRTITEKKIVVGICLGAQLIADVLNAKVYKNRYKEIGWFPVKKSRLLGKESIFSDFEKETNVFHWHGDTFDIPKGGKRIFSSSGCKNQAFQYGDKVFGFQFHFEVNEKSIMQLVENASSDITDDKFVQTDITGEVNATFIIDVGKTMDKIMNKIVHTARN